MGFAYTVRACRCIECGFCESNCPSRDLSLTPRQRIATYKEMSRLKAIPNPTAAVQKRLADFQQAFDYDGDATCAADGMCQQKCPVKINTGALISPLPTQPLSRFSNTFQPFYSILFCCAA